MVAEHELRRIRARFIPTPLVAFLFLRSRNGIGAGVGVDSRLLLLYGPQLPLFPGTAVVAEHGFESIRARRARFFPMVSRLPLLFRTAMVA
jgi:hypothetical protein